MEKHHVQLVLPSSSVLFLAIRKIRHEVSLEADRNKSVSIINDIWRFPKMGAP